MRIRALDVKVVHGFQIQAASLLGGSNRHDAEQQPG